jgi:valyl-tRNA synthetase
MLQGLAIDHDAAAEIQRIKQTVSLLRAMKAEQGEAANRQVAFVVEGADRQWATVEASMAKLKRMLGAGSITRGATTPGAPVCITAHGSWTLLRQLRGDPAAERARLTREIEALTRHIAGTEARLANVTFVSKAPPAVLEGARKQLGELQAKKAENVRLLAGLD